MLLGKDACVIYGFFSSQFASSMCQKKKLLSEHGSLTSKPLEKFTGLIQRLKHNMSNTKGSAKHKTHAQKNYYLNPSFSFSFFRYMDILPFQKKKKPMYYVHAGPAKARKGQKRVLGLELIDSGCELSRG